MLFLNLVPKQMLKTRTPFQSSTNLVSLKYLCYKITLVLKTTAGMLDSCPYQFIETKQQRGLAKQVGGLGNSSLHQGKISECSQERVIRLQFKKPLLNPIVRDNYCMIFSVLFLGKTVECVEAFEIQVPWIRSRSISV